MSFGTGVASGIDVAALAKLSVDRGVFDGLTGAAVSVEGTADIDNTLVVRGTDAVVLAGSGNLKLRYTTVADNTGVGVNNTGSGGVSITSSILHGNGGGDLLGVPCTALTWSLIGSVDCSSVEPSNLPPQSPGFDANHHLLATSPCLDHGPHPATYAGDPLTDGDGSYRLRDHNGDGLAQSDCGAYERENTALPVGEVLNLLWTDKVTLTWDAEPSAVEYHVYRDDLVNVSYARFGECADTLDPTRTDTALTDAEEPPPGQCFTYLIAAQETGGDEGTLGFAAGAERSNFCPCPDPCP